MMRISLSDGLQNKELLTRLYRKLVLVGTSHDGSRLSVSGNEKHVTQWLINWLPKWLVPYTMWHSYGEKYNTTFAHNNRCLSSSDKLTNDKTEARHQGNSPANSCLAFCPFSQVSSKGHSLTMSMHSCTLPLQKKITPTSMNKADGDKNRQVWITYYSFTTNHFWNKCLIFMNIFLVLHDFNKMEENKNIS